MTAGKNSKSRTSGSVFAHGSGQLQCNPAAVGPPLTWEPASGKRIALSEVRVHVSSSPHCVGHVNPIRAF